MLLVVVLLSVSSLAFAQYNPGSLDVYSDVGQTSCNFTDAGFLSVFIFHTHTDGATAARFALELPESGTYTLLGDLWQFQTIIGNTRDGVSIGYGNCVGQTSDVYLGQANYATAGPSAACGLITVVPDPTATSGLVEFVDCAAPAEFAYISVGGQGRVNSDGTCDCTVPVQETTWGGIKALYD
jgi:hypothetical protein